MSPKEECEVLMNELMPIGINFLKKYGEFYPYAAVMNMDGSIRLLEYYDGNEFPESKDLINNLRETCQQFAGNKEIKASGIVWNTSLISSNAKEEDVILVSLEHKDEYSIKVALPYKKGFFKKVKLGNLLALEGEKTIF
jgi:lipid II:glycine glycyltransferase (peptidoglycan interpeptide bridge formation enzyme)